MNVKLRLFWEMNKDIIKNTIIVVAVPLAVVCLYNINRMNKIMVENNIKELFYGEDEDIEEKEESFKLEQQPDNTWKIVESFDYSEEA